MKAAGTSIYSPKRSGCGQPVPHGHRQLIDAFLCSLGRLSRWSGGPEISEAITGADNDLLITGNTRNQLLTKSNSLLEAALHRGCGLRVVLLDPATSAIDVAAERYHPGRSPDVLRNRIRASSQILAALAKITGVTVELRYTGHPLATGIIAVNCADNRRDPSWALLCEYFPYRGPGPMFTMQPADGPAFDAYLGEAEFLWAGATPVRF
jgi:hypothetical protein